MAIMEKEFLVFTDGGAKGNPGPAAIGVVIKNNQGKILAQFGKDIGRATNNVAEYTAVIEALKWLKENYPIAQCKFFLDSKLVVNQLNGLFKIKNSNLRNLIIKVRSLERALSGKIFYHFIPREKNRQADFLVNNFNKKNF